MATFLKCFYKSPSYLKWNPARCLSTTTVLNVSLTVDPPSCLQDEPVHIRCTGLKPGENITLTNSCTDHRGSRFFSVSHFRADSIGCVDLNVSGSLGGNFEGVFPMGPFITLESIEDGPKGVGYSKKDEAPFFCTLSALKGHLVGDAAHQPDQDSLLSKTSHERLYLAPGVEVIKVHSGKIRGNLYIPPGEGSFPGIIDLYGTSGGLNPTRASLLASRGIASLALAFFNYEDLPQTPEEIDLGYFEEAVQYLLSHPKVIKPHVGVVGLSKGGDIALSMGTFIDAVKATVTVNCIPANTWWPLRVKEKVYPFLPMDTSQLVMNEDNTVDVFKATKKCEDHPESCLPIENADTKFLFIAGEDDQNWDSMEINYAIKRLKAHGKDNYELLSYKGAGHFINPPYSSLLRIGYHSFVKLYFNFGGNAKELSDAQVDSWQKMLTFLKSNLAPTQAKL